MKVGYGMHEDGSVTNYTNWRPNQADIFILSTSPVYEYETSLDNFVLKIELDIERQGTENAWCSKCVYYTNDYGQQYYFGIDGYYIFVVLRKMNDTWNIIVGETYSLSYDTVYELNLKIEAYSSGDTKFYADDNLIFDGTQSLTEYLTEHSVYLEQLQLNGMQLHSSVSCRSDGIATIDADTLQIDVSDITSYKLSIIIIGC